ncbi:MAG TPA: DUF1295 domain-containing protein [Clostridia bacterium]
MKRSVSFLIVAAVYILAIAAGVAVFLFLNRYLNAILATFIADVIATLIVWGFGLAFKNASMYDPYWSVQPLVIIIGWLIYRFKPLNIIDILMLISVGFWSIRLTYNWASGFMGLTKTQDWRYVMLKEKHPKMYFIINLFGINLMPTVLVYLGTAPLYFVIFGKPSNFIFASIGMLIMITAAAIQLIADRQMREFREDESNRGLVMDRGLWGYSRHPNYFGEITFWYGVFVFSLCSSVTKVYWIAGAVLITLLFLFISIPMIEQKLSKSRPAYQEYKQKVSMLLPLPPKRTEIEAEENN